MHEIDIKLKLTDEGIRGFIDTMREGAIAYWDESGRMEFDPTHCDPENWIVAGVLVYEDPTGDDLLRQVVDHAWVANAVAKALDPAFNVNETLRSAIYDCAVRDAIGELDWDGVDTVMQAGLFGELVYG